jgi:hypothetical protein
MPDNRAVPERCLRGKRLAGQALVPSDFGWSFSGGRSIPIRCKSGRVSGVMATKRPGGPNCSPTTFRLRMSVSSAAKVSQCLCQRDFDTKAGMRRIKHVSLSNLRAPSVGSPQEEQTAAPTVAWPPPVAQRAGRRAERTDRGRLGGRHAALSEKERRMSIFPRRPARAPGHRIYVCFGTAQRRGSCPSGNSSRMSSACFPL